MNIISVTGTKGTTTTTHFLQAALQAATGRPAALISSIGVFDGVQWSDNGGYTTPPAPVVQACVERSQANGCGNLALELSSIGEKEGRADGLTLDYGVFTNLGPDHVGPNDEHASLEEYYFYKRKIVSRYVQAVLNRDDASYPDMVKAAEGGLCKRMLSYSTQAESGADIWAEDIQRTEEGMAFVAVTDAWQVPMTVPMPGVYNVSNALGAMGVIRLMDLEPAAAAAAIAETRIAGRSETYRKDGKTAVVDYAHNAISFHAILSEMRIRHPDGKVRILFGVGGGRIERRRGMAEESAKLADVVYVTSDNPRDEDPHMLCQVLQDLIHQYGGTCQVIIDRATAVRKALGDMEKGDVLILAGKGPETSITINGVSYPYEGDAGVVKAAWGL